MGLWTIRCAAPSSLLLGVALSFAACQGTLVDGTTAGSPATGSSTGGSAPTTTGGFDIAQSTTTGGMAGCANGWTPCTPANICVLGVLLDGGLCVDQLSADPAQTGARCAGGAGEGTHCRSPGPQVPTHGGGVCTTGRLATL